MDKSLLHLFHKYEGELDLSPPTDFRNLLDSNPKLKPGPRLGLELKSLLKANTHSQSSPHTDFDSDSNSDSDSDYTSNCRFHARAPPVPRTTSRLRTRPTACPDSAFARLASLRGSRTHTDPRSDFDSELGPHYSRAHEGLHQRAVAGAGRWSRSGMCARRAMHPGRGHRASSRYVVDSDDPGRITTYFK